MKIDVTNLDGLEIVALSLKLATLGFATQHISVVRDTVWLGL